ncbi:hypothetical protein CXR04_34395 [Streptomyces sp. CMB-StM0423]|nr:hypothetical protein CXR04_34395 [Streptomyces sp. CMB-StM0423]
MRRRLSGVTLSGALSRLLTVPTATPAARATSLIVTRPGAGGVFSACTRHSTSFLTGAVRKPLTAHTRLSTVTALNRSKIYTPLHLQRRGLYMPENTSRRRLGGLTVVVSVALVLTACGVEDGSGEMVEGGKGSYTAAEVAEATGTYKVRSLYAVPKTHERYRLAFINPSTSFPFFASWSQGMKAAAEFYGVDLMEADLAFKYDQAQSKYDDLAVKQPDLVGGGGSSLNAPTVAAANRDETPVLLIDGAMKGATDFGINDRQVGELAVEQLTGPVKEKQKSAWKGRKLIVAGISAGNCPPCDARVNAAFAKAQAEWGVSKSDTFRLVPPGTDPTAAAQDTFTDFLTAHPDDVVAVVSYGDEPVVGALNAAKSGRRDQDVLAVANGGDTAARHALRDRANQDMLIGAIDYQPYAEGWNWVEAAIATLRAEDFAEYQVNRVLTADNVDKYYPDDAGAK